MFRIIAEAPLRPGLLQILGMRKVRKSPVLDLSYEAFAKPKELVATEPAS